MSPALRRALLFLLMVGAGLAAVVLLSDEGQRTEARIEDLTGTQGDAARVHVRDAGGETQVSFGELDFDVMQPVEVAPGRSEDRVAARVHVASARPGADGDFVAQSPDVTLLDTTTGAPRGRISAREARFETDAVAGGITIDLSHLRARDWSLRGDVRGEFPLRRGGTARLAAEELHVHDAVLRAPGRVSWSREDLVLTGNDLLWDGPAGRLSYDSDAHVLMAPAANRAALELDARGGLVWTAPPDSDAPGYGELRGGVSGAAGDGSRLDAQTLLIDESGRLTLQGDARLQRAEPDGSRTQLAARTIVLVRDETGHIRSATADGAVLLTSTPAAGAESRVAAEQLELVGRHARASGRVTVEHGGLVVSGTGLDADGETGRLEFTADAAFSVAQDSGHALAGLSLLSPTGLVCTVPPGAAEPLAAATGELRGPVTGTLPDGSSLAAELGFFDGTEGAFRLEGSVKVHRVLGGEESTLTARRLLLRAERPDAPAALFAEGDVSVLSGPPGGTPAHLRTESLRGEGALLVAPHQVTWTQGDVTVAGHALTWDRAVGRLGVAGVTRITFLDPRGRRPAELIAPGGFTWNAPPGARDLFREGRGELRGPVTGRTADGGKLACDTLRLDGVSSTLGLHGHARLELVDAAGPSVLESEALDFCFLDDRNSLHVAHAVRWSTQARGMLLDARGLDWSLPAGGGDPLREGRGEALGPVHLLWEGRELDAARLSVDGPGGTWRLQGPATAALPDGGRFAARQSIDLFLAPDGSLARLDAVVEAEARYVPADGAPVRLAADSLVLDRAQRLATLAGHATVEQGEDAARRSVTAARIVAQLDETDAPLAVQAQDGVEAHVGEVVAHCDALDWDVPGDLLVLTGAGRLLAAGLWMSFTRAEVQPGTGRVHIDRGDMHAEG